MASVETDLGNGWKIVTDDQGRLKFYKNGQVTGGFLSDGMWLVSSKEADYNNTSGTAPGTVCTEHNRAYRSMILDGSTTARLITLNNANEKVVGGERGDRIVLADRTRYPNQSNSDGEIQADDPNSAGQGWRNLKIQN